MQSSWTCTRIKMPWTGPGDRVSWRGGVGPRALRLLRIYWVRLRMVVRVRGYYGTLSRVTVVLPGGTHFPHGSSITLWTQLSATMLFWWRRIRPTLELLVSLWHIRQTFSTHMTDSLPPPT